MADQSIKVLITGDGAQLSKALNTAGAQLAAFSTKATASLARFGRGLSLIGGAAFTGLAAGAKRGINALDELGKAAEKTGVAVEDLAKLRYAGELADVDIPTLDKALARLNKTLGEARQGNRAAIEALSDLGIAATDSVLPAMMKLSDALLEIPDAADRGARLSAVFGKEWAALVPMLNKGGDELQRLGDELQRMGGVPTKQATDAAQEFNDNITRLGIAIAGPFNAALRDALPYLSAMSQSMVNATSAAGGFFKLFENKGKKLGLEVAIAQTNFEIQRLQTSLEYVSQQAAKGYLKLDEKEKGELAAAAERLQSLFNRLKEQEARLAALNQSPDIAQVVVGMAVDPAAVQNVPQQAAAISQAATQSVPPIIVPMAISPTGAIGSYSDLQQEFLRQQIPGNAAGGMIRGPGTGTSDSILSWLSNGEYVVRSAAVQHYGADLFRAINNMALPRFAGGGQVSAGAERFAINLGGGSYTAQIAPDVGAALRRELRLEIARRGAR